jgi:hypothetical protein
MTQVIVLRLVRAAAMAVAGAAVTLAQLNLPSKSFWDGQVRLLWASVIVLAFYICWEAVRSVNYAVQAKQIRSYDNDLRAAVSAAVSATVLATGVPWDEITICYYRRRGVLRQRLARVGAFSAGAEVTTAQRSTRSGVDVVGTAFATQEIIAVEWRSFVLAATAQGLAKWRERDPDSRYGLTWGQLRRSHQPEGVVASPTFDVRGKPDGCILLTGPLKEHDLCGDEMRRTLDDLATVLDLIGPPPPGWWGAHEY